MKELLENSLKYRQWVETLQKNNIAISRVEPLNLIHKKSGELLFALLSIDAKAPNGEKLLPIALVRGHFVSVAVILIERETQEKYVLLVRQYRIASGEYTYEHPAGMCDSSTDIWQVAIKEIAEKQVYKSRNLNCIYSTKSPFTLRLVCWMKVVICFFVRLNFLVPKSNVWLTKK